jgi:hypothetical protein
MVLSAQIAKHIRDVHSGGNWAGSSLKEHLSDITWQQATTKVHSFNVIASLVYHMNYYVSAILKVLQGEPLNASDKYSFDHSPILNHEDWQRLLDKTWADAELFASLVEQLPDSRLLENFSDGKYGNHFRNIIGVIEHIHYHLGQIVLIKKIIQHTSN